jgi:HK97 family phage portal protein
VGLYEDFRAVQRQRRNAVELAWPVGAGSVVASETSYGHDASEWAPEAYGDYVATSNEVYSVASKRARLMSGLTLRLYAGVGSKKKEITSGPAAEALTHVNPFWSPKRLARMDELSMCLWGQTAWAVEQPPDGPAEIWWLKPSRLRPVPHESRYLAGFLYEPIMGGELIPFLPDEVVWFRHPNPNDEFSPLSPLAAARLAADTASAMMRSNQNLFTQGLQMGGLVVPDTDKVTFSEKQAGELEGLLERRWKGVDKAHRWTVLRYEAQLKALTVTPKDAEFVNGLNLTMKQVCNAYGMQSALLNDLEHATLSNVRDLERIEWASALKPDAEMRAEEIREQFLPIFGRRPGRPGTPDHCEFDFSTVDALQESAAAQWARERQAIEIGRKTINEIRRANGEPDVPWGDVWWAPVNKSAVSGASSKPQGDTAPTGEPVDAEQAASLMAMTDLALMEMRHGPLALNGRNDHNGRARL